jgi:hypothetical protein
VLLTEEKINSNSLIDVFSNYYGRWFMAIMLILI